MSVILSDRLIQILGYLRDHPQSSARDIAAATGMIHHDREVYSLLRNAEFDGYVRSSNAGRGPWLWEICPKGLKAIPAVPDPSVAEARQELWSARARALLEKAIREMDSLEVLDLVTGAEACLRIAAGEMDPSEMDGYELLLDEEGS